MNTVRHLPWICPSSNRLVTVTLSADTEAKFFTAVVVGCTTAMMVSSFLLVARMRPDADLLETVHYRDDCCQQS